MINETPTFGAIITKPDKRDFKLEVLGTNTPIPESYSTDISNIPVLHQRKQPACGSHSATSLKMIQEKHDDETNPNYTPRLHWKVTKSRDGIPLDNGMTINDLFKSLQSPSVCDLSLLDNDTSLTIQDYFNFTSTPEQIENAKGKLIDNYAITHKPTFEQLKRAIYTHKAVIVLYRCGQNMYKGANGISSWAEKDILPLSPDRYPMDSGHFVVAYGYTKDRIIWRNSWGITWGANGDGYFNADYMKHVVAIGTAIDKTDITPKVVPMTWYEKFLAIIKKDNLIEYDAKLGRWVYKRK